MGEYPCLDLLFGRNMSLSVVLLLLGNLILITASNPTISTFGSVDDNGTFEVGSDVTVVCEIPSYNLFMNWKIGLDIVADCTLTICSPRSQLPGHYLFSHDTVSGIFNLTIDEVKYSDNGYVLTCENENDAASLSVTVKDPVVSIPDSHSRGNLDKKKCKRIWPGSSCAYLVILSQAIFLGYVIFYLWIKFENNYFGVSDAFVIWFASVPVVGLIGIVFLARKVFSNRKKPCCSSIKRVLCMFHLLMIIPMVYYLKLYRKHHKKGTFKIFTVCIILLYIISLAPYGTPVLGCWNKVTDQFSPDYKVIIFIILPNIFLIWITLLLVLLCLQHLQTLKFKDLKETWHTCKTLKEAVTIHSLQLSRHHDEEERPTHHLFGTAKEEVTCIRCKQRKQGIETYVCVTSLENGRNTVTYTHDQVAEIIESDIYTTQSLICDSCVEECSPPKGLFAETDEIDKTEYNLSVIGYCKSCGRDVCVICLGYCKTLNHHLVMTANKLPKLHIFLIVVACTPFLGIVAILILWFRNYSESRRSNTVQSVATVKVSKSNVNLEILAEGNI